jgi:hypothetical protein
VKTIVTDGKTHSIEGKQSENEVSEEVSIIAHSSEVPDAKTNNNAADTTDEAAVPNRDADAQREEGEDSFDLDKSIDDGFGGIIRERG